MATVAGRVDVDAQKRGDASKKPDGGKKPGAHMKASEDADEGKPQFGPRGHIAGGLFGKLYSEERRKLIDEAKGDDEEAQRALIAHDKAALDEVIEELDDEEIVKSVQMIILIGNNFELDSTEATTLMNISSSTD